MRYLITFALSCFVSLFVYVGLVPLFNTTPVAAEYWVRELLVIKQSIARQHTGKKKIIIASGSSTLFSIDTKQMSTALGLPVLNLGLMGGMPLSRILSEASRAAEAKDTILLALEPDYYCREKNTGFDEWVLRNAIAWDRESWSSLSATERLSAIQKLGFRFPLEIIRTQFDLIFNREALNQRLFALNDEKVLQKYANPPTMADNLYSVYNIDRLGNIKNTDEQNYQGAPRRADTTIQICEKTFDQLEDFIRTQRERSIDVYFINTPFVSQDGIDLDRLATASTAFIQQLSLLAPVIDDRFDVVLDRKYFLNSELHLNSLGRKIRTDRLLEAIKRTKVLYLPPSHPIKPAQLN
jgi:hypothetical protein